MSDRRSIGDVLFDGFELVDVFGPLEQRQARWVEDGNVITSSRVSAGINMSLAVIARLVDQETAEKTATWAEYDWHRDADWDPFAKLQGMPEALSSC